ncbi:MraY family glycosyltransferase [Flavobacterium beibuense]|uniref:Putative UndPP-QuiNAc-P-transferase n=1 Tax=Flavobacterium beibuense TaxID=657326 RepID=A0A444WIM6_9FLAO|nr:glycosyltransferase family 4 protein [Flavobacterium beibuense]RYJ45596.1 putative UndPP-QuiNAc-P-transferase [Flavobacterium beibuense]
MLDYFLIFISLLILILIYFKIADRYNIIDKPNERSSHSVVTIRGGGVVFSIAVVIAFLLGYATLSLTAAVLLVAVVSFIDDIKPLHQLPRFFSHFIAVLLIVLDLEIYNISLLLLPVILIFGIGWINLFNFMDGINGITVLYSLSCIITLGFVYKMDEAVFPVLVIMGLSCLVFALFNVRKKAKTFAGDIGSISMAVFLGYFLLKLVLKTNEIGYMLLISIYAVDSIVTIIYRIREKENIFKPHRTHLYQYLANELKIPHLVVSFSYAFIQIAINVLVIYTISIDVMTIYMFFGILVLLTAVYLLLRGSVLKKISDNA